MTRCQHCKKLTHSEHVNVYFNVEDFEKIAELEALENWTNAFNYSINTVREVGKLKCGDIVLHFIAFKEEKS